MTPERWRKIEELYNQTLSCAPAGRMAFLAAECGSDEELRRRVEMMLAQSSSDGILDGPAAEALGESLAESGAGAGSSLSPGDLLGPYQIVGLVGAGGMGQVWKARDSRLNRDVAIKVSAHEFTDRFGREALAIAALNHANICTLYDLGPNYLVMELVEGPTLAERIRRGPVPLEEALHIANQIADALAVAHENGIVHRDLKPANIKIRPDGSVKVLDFGLAKAGERAGIVPDTQTMTTPGTIMGTPAYMAPEQARGEKVDKRADVWAFGVVLYEMSTGRRLFEGNTMSDTLAAVLTREPEWERAPARLHKLLRACLEKDPKARLHDIADARLLVEETSVADPVVAGRSTGAGLLLRALMASVALLALILSVVSFLHFREKPPASAEQLRFQIPARTDGRQLFCLSPDGRTLAFMARGRLWVHSLASGESRDLTSGFGTPFWSPDSRFIGYRDGAKLMKIEAAGGIPQTVANVRDDWGGGTWNRDDVILYSEQQFGLGTRP